MLLKLLLAFTLIPLIELYLLFQLAQATTFGTTLLIVIATGILGSILARREGASAWRRLRESLSNQGGGPRFPTTEVRDGLMIAFAAALLLTPGILTDALGFLLLVPAGRAVIAKYVLPRLFRNVQLNVFASTTVDASGGTTRSSTTFRSGNRSNNSNTIDAEPIRRD